MDSNPSKSRDRAREPYTDRVGHLLADLAGLRKITNSPRRIPVEDPAISHTQRTHFVLNGKVLSQARKRKVSAQVDDEDDVQFVSERLSVSPPKRMREDSKNIGRSNRDDPKKPAEVDLSLPHPVITIIIAPFTDRDTSSNELSINNKKEGSSQVTFTVHKSYICAASPFFKAAFNGNFQEGLSQSMTFTDIDASLFGVFNHWVYYNTVKCPMEGGEANFEELGKLWLLGQRFLTPAFQNAVMDKLFNSKFSVVEDNHFCDFVKLAYNIEEEGRDVLRKVVIYRLSELDRRLKEIALGDELVLAWKDMAIELEAQVTRELGPRSMGYGGSPHTPAPRRPDRRSSRVVSFYVSGLSAV